MKFSEWTECRGLTDAQVVAKLAKRGVLVSLISVRSWRKGRRRPNAKHRLAIEALTRREVRLTDWDDT